MNASHVASYPPERNWPLVAAGAVLGCVGVGVIFALAVLLGPMSVATGWSRGALSSAMTLAFLSMGVGGFAWVTQLVVELLKRARSTQRHPQPLTEAAR